MEQLSAVNFHNAYINADVKELDRLWKEVAPSDLIKFYPARYEPDGSNYFLKHLTNRTLWLSSPAFFNDPFDCVINFDYRKEVEKISKNIFKLFMEESVAREIMAVEHVTKELSKITDLLQQEIGPIHRRIEESVYTTCFTEKENLHSLRMWGHYANCHSGVCAEYSFDDVNQSTPFGCIPIKYTDAYEYLINPTNSVEQVFNFLKLYTKSVEWQYEKEWRVCQQREGFTGKGFDIAFTQPKKIYLGCKVDECLKNDVFESCEKQGIELYQMTMQPGSFYIDSIKIR